MSALNSGILWRVSKDRAPFASDPYATRGRRWAEAESVSRSPFERDRDRIIHASAFRRLKQKTQVFVAHEGDHYRTRLTHSLEVAQIARSVARRLGLDEDLAEATALAHDLGHPPFGHTGEDVLDECMAQFGGFDHNAQTVRVLTKLESRYPTFDGLNLTWETIEGVVKHNGPFVPKGGDTANVKPVWRSLVDEYGLGYDTYASLEAQVAGVADDIAYNNHDIDDGLRAGLFSIEDICGAVPLVAEAFAGVRKDFPDLDQDRAIGEAVRRLIGLWVNDLLLETKRRLALKNPQSADDVRHAGMALVGFSDEMTAKATVLRRFLLTRMYRHWKVMRARSQARRVVRELFNVFMAEPDTLPPPWGSHAEDQDRFKAARAVADYIAGMTDIFAIDEHRRLFNLDRWY